MPSLHDTRLLANLLKTEKDAATAFKHYAHTAATAGSALSAWSVADSADTPDLMDAAIRISQLIATCSDSQRLYLQALSAYRAALKEVLAREQALRTVLRDREILVNRLIKIGNKKVKDGQEADHQHKLDDAQRELQACETFLQEEEIALATAKRRSFRHGLQQRMQSMVELSRVMEECAAEAVAILAQLPSPDGDDDAEHYDATAAHAYDVASDMGDSIAPSQSASQAMSRASSSSSLNDEYHANAPPIPNNLRIDPLPARAASPPPRSPVVRAKSPLRSPVNAPQPVMPAVPSAPPPISSKVYVERHAGMPTFDIPKAPDLSRRPDDSDSESDYGEPAAPAAMRSSHYPLDSPPLRQQASSMRLRRRAMSDTSSVNESTAGGGRKRRGSFFGGIASLFSRNKGRRDREPSGGSAPPEFDYGSARSRLAGTGANGGGAAAAESRNDAVLRSVLNAGKLPARRRGGDDGGDSSDEERRPTTRHVNDPKERYKAFSDVGRSSSPARPVATRSHVAASEIGTSSRPKLQRKGTSASTSTARPHAATTATAAAATAEPNGSGLGVERKKTRKVKKAASDIGPASAMPQGWSTGGPLSRSTGAGATSLEVPRAPGRGDGIDALASGATLPPPPAIPQQQPAFAPRSSGTPSSPAETGSLRRKKTKKVAPSGGVTQPSETVILSAEALGIPTSSTPASSGAAAATSNGAPVHRPELSRSNTASTTATAATVERRKKKKLAKPAPPLASGPPPALAAPLPTSDDLAATLPKSVSGTSALNAQLPRPDDQPPTTALSSRPQSAAAPVARPAWMNKDDSDKPVKALVDKEKKSKRMSSLHGVTNETWVSNPGVGAPATRAPPRRAEGHIGEESLLTVVDRAEGNERTSRSYGTTPLATQGLAPASAATAGLPSPSGALSAALPSAPPAQSHQPSSQAVLPRPPTLDVPASQLTKRKSVRLAEAADPSPPLSSATMTPSLSMRSSSSTAAPRHGILIQREASPAPGSVAASLSERAASPSRADGSAQSNGGGGGGGGIAGAWPTRASIRAAMDDSSDSDEEGRRAYRQARKMLGRGTKEMDDAMAGRKAPTSEEKGKSRAVDA
ncbi:hypothetical protein JCM3775_007149 [Rhodotorula graminis]